MKYDSVLDQQSISGKTVSLILCVWKPCYVKSGHIYIWGKCADKTLSMAPFFLLLWYALCQNYVTKAVNK